jgi:hypothetical protein
MADSQSLHEQIESSVAHHDQGGPDETSIVNNAVEQHGMLRRAKDGAKDIADLDPRDRLRATIRQAVHSAKQKSASQQSPEVQGGPPSSWSKEAKAQWDNLPQEVRMATMREGARLHSAVEPAAEVLRVYEARRGSSKAPNASAAQILSSAYDWESALTGPDRHRAAAYLFSATGIDPAQVVSIMQGQPQYSQAQQYQPQEQSQQYSQQDVDAAAVRAVTEFGASHPHLDKVRFLMAGLLSEAQAQGRTMDLQEAYDRAMTMHPEFAGENERKRAAAVSGRTRSPAGPGVQQRSTGVRGAIRDAIRASRGQV